MTDFSKKWWVHYMEEVGLPNEEVITYNGLIFHDPQNVESHMGGEVLHFNEAVSEKIKPCGKCFEKMRSFQEVYQRKRIKKLL